MFVKNFNDYSSFDNVMKYNTEFRERFPIIKKFKLEYTDSPLRMIYTYTGDFYASIIIEFFDTYSIYVEYEKIENKIINDISKTYNSLKYDDMLNILGKLNEYFMKLFS